MQRRKKFLVGIAVLLISLWAMLPAGAQREEKVVRAAFDKALPPFSYVEENGDVTGFTIDLMKAIAGMSGYELELVPLEWEDAVGQLKNGRVDVVLGMKYSSFHDKLFDFSESFFTMSDILLVPRTDHQIYTLNQLKGKVVAVQRGNPTIDLLESVRRVGMVVAFSQPEALEFLVNGRADAYIGNRWTAEYILRKQNRWADYETRSGLINPTDYAFAVRKGNYELLNQLNEGLAGIYRNGTYTRLYSHYFEPYSPHVTDFWRKLVIGLLIMMSIALIVLVMSFFWNKRLQAEVRRQTAALADSLSFQRKVLDNTESAIFSLDTQGRITLVNQVAITMLQLKENATGAMIRDVLPQLPIEAALSSANGQQCEGEFQLEDGTGRILSYYIAAFSSSRTDKPIGWIISLQDRTEQKHWQARLIAQEKMRALGQLVAGIAHELRNPLTAIKAFIEMLPKKMDDQRFREELLRYVPEEVSRMNRILEDLLDYSRTKPLQLQVVNLREMVESVTGLLANRFSSEQVEVRLEIEHALLVRADRGRLKQVLLNLVLNAMEAMAKGKEKKLLITATQDEGEIRLSVRDTGEGMEPADLKQLFQPFYTTKTQGIGLGLYLSQKIMREHGGRIEVESMKGKGSAFHLLFQQTLVSEQRRIRNA